MSAPAVPAIRTALTTLCQPGTVHELRVPNAGRQRTISGYFNDVDLMAQAAAALSGNHPGIYVTANPVNPALLARAENKVIGYAETTTADHDIIRRRRLPVDLDPRRPAGISATAEEHEAAHERAREIYTQLRLWGWPTPLTVDTGNGYCLLYTIDLPNDDDSRLLVQRCLRALSFEFDDDQVHVDQSMYNAARIVRIPGTLNRKGDSTRDRPHREARMVGAPDAEPVSAQLIKHLAASVVVEESSTLSTDGRHASPPFDLAAFIAGHGLDVRRAGPYQNGTRWLLATCPLHGESVAGSSCAVIQWPSGTIIFKCQHNRCVGRTWHDLRAQLEPDRREKQAVARLKSQKQAPAAKGASTPSMTAAVLLDDVRGRLRRYLILPDDHFYDVVALWVLHAHAVDAADTSPRLIFKSPEKESGKTRALEVLELLVPAPLAVMNATIAAIFRLLKDEQATVLFDEVDAIFNSKVGNYEDLRALLNAGYRRGATVARVVGEGKAMRTERYPVFAATALAAIGDLPDTIESRAIILPMRRRAPHEHVEQFRRRRVAGELEDLRAGLIHWATEHIDGLATADPAMPDELTDRAADCWEPLLAIADLAGGEWPRRARDAAIAVVKGRVAEDASIGVRLLADIKVVTDGKDRMPSAALCAALNALEESGWGGWNDGKGIGQRDLAKRLKRYGIDSKVIRLSDGSTPRGYMTADLLDPFARYLRVSSSGSATSATSATPIRIPVADVADVALPGGTDDADPGTTVPPPSNPAQVSTNGPLSAVTAALLTAFPGAKLVARPYRSTAADSVVAWETP